VREENQILHRHSIRLKEYDYGQAGAYFVTICAHRRECLFGEIVEGKMHLSKAGMVLQAYGKNCRSDISIQASTLP